MHVIFVSRNSLNKYVNSDGHNQAAENNIKELATN